MPHRILIRRVPFTMRYHPFLPYTCNVGECHCKCPCKQISLAEHCKNVDVRVTVCNLLWSSCYYRIRLDTGPSPSWQNPWGSASEDTAAGGAHPDDEVDIVTPHGATKHRVGHANEATSAEVHHGQSSQIVFRKPTNPKTFVRLQSIQYDLLHCE